MSTPDVEAQLINAYAEGRKDEYEFVLLLLADEIEHAKRMARENGGNPRYDYYADAFEMFRVGYKDEP